MADFCAELATLVAAYDEHGGKWPQHHEEALLQAVDRARAVLAQPEPTGAAATAAVAAAIAAGQPVTLPSGTVIADPAWFESLITIRAADPLERQAAAAPVAADGEVAELVVALRVMAVEADRACQFSDADVITRSADLLERQALRPIPVSERLPGPSVKVLAHYFNHLGKGRTICAIRVPAKTRSDSYGDGDFTEYDEVSDTFYCPEGWYETIENWDGLGYIKVDEGEVLYWQPLPKWPAHALPLPEFE